MTDYVEKRRSGMDFANEFNEILNEFFGLIGHFDEDIPLWLNTIGGLHFSRWYKYQQIYWYLHDHYDELTENQHRDFLQIHEMGIDENFRETCKTCLEECDRKGSWLQQVFKYRKNFKQLNYHNYETEW